MTSRAREHFAFVRSTKQAWKFWAALVLFSLACAATLVYDFGPAATRSLAASCSAWVGLLAIVLYLSIRCPACKKSLG